MLGYDLIIQEGNVGADVGGHLVLEYRSSGIHLDRVT